MCNQGSRFLLGIGKILSLLGCWFKNYFISLKFGSFSPVRGHNYKREIFIFKCILLALSSCVYWFCRSKCLDWWSYLESIERNYVYPIFSNSSVKADSTKIFTIFTEYFQVGAMTACPPGRPWTLTGNTLRKTLCAGRWWRDSAGVENETKPGRTGTSLTAWKTEPRRNSFSRNFGHCFETSIFVKDFYSSSILEWSHL